ncbi:MAG: TldD/PmbA family protein, partial [Candidatus Thorarchaeota archaeon]
NVTYADLRIENSLMTQIRTVNKKVERSTTGIESGIGIRILKDGAWGFAYGPIDNFTDIIKMAVQANKLNLKHKKDDIKLAEIKIFEDDFEGKQKKKIDDIGFDEKIQMTFETDKAQEDEKIKSRTSVYREVLRNMTLATTEGTRINYSIPYLRLGAISVAREGNETIETYSIAGHLGGLELMDVRSPQEIGEKAKERALEGLKAPKLKNGRYPAVIDGTLNHVFAHEAAGHSAEADLAENAGVLKGKLGKRIANSNVNMIDDGKLKKVNKVEHFGNIKYDDEGVPGQRTHIIRNGILETYLHDRASAAQFNTKSTGNSRVESYAFPQIIRMTNTFIAPAKNPMNHEELFELIKNGYLLLQAGGGQVSSIEGTFNFGVGEVYEIKNGEIGQRYRPTTLAGNTLETLNKIIGISPEMGDPLISTGFCGKDGQSVPVAGTAGWIAIKNIVIG